MTVCWPDIGLRRIPRRARGELWRGKLAACGLAPGAVALAKAADAGSPGEPSDD